MDKWISCKDALPPFGESVLVAFTAVDVFGGKYKAVTSAHREPGYFSSDLGSVKIDGEFWMKLPEPPEPEKEGENEQENV